MTYQILSLGYRFYPLSHAHLLHVLRYSPDATTVVDVRRSPDGDDVRRSTDGLPAWTAAAISDLLGPRYLSIPALGNHPDAAPRQWKLLDRDAASAALDLLVDRYLAGDHPVLLLCAEFRAADCHRRLVAQHLQKRLLLRVPEAIVEVKHLL